MKFYQQKEFRPYQRKTTHRLCKFHQEELSVEEEQNSRQHAHCPHFYKAGDFQSSPTFNHRENTGSLENRNMSEPIWEHLYTVGLRSQRQLHEAYLINQNKIDVQCTFQPIIQQSKRYLLASCSPFLQRVNAWQQQKIEKMVKQKQELTSKDLKQCTFSPQINKNYSRKFDESQTKLINRTKTSKNRFQVTSKSKNPLSSPSKIKANAKENYSSNRKVGQRETFEMQKIKQLVRRELKKINL